MDYIKFFSELIVYLVLLSIVMFVPAAILWAFIVSACDRSETLVRPFCQNLRDSLRSGPKWFLKRTIRQGTSDDVYNRSRLLNKPENMDIRNLARVGTVVAIYRLQFLRLSKEGERAKLKMRPISRLWPVHLWKLFFGYSSTEKEEAIDHTINYGFAHGKNFATERPVFYITPQSVEDEGKVEKALDVLEKIVCRRRLFGKRQLSQMMEQYVMINEQQSMTYQWTPKARMYAVVDPQPNTRKLLESELLKFIEPDCMNGIDFSIWLRGTIEEFAKQNKIYSKKGRIGKRLAVVFFSLRLVTLQLRRMPIVRDPEEYQKMLSSTKDAYIKFFPSIKKYLESEGDGNRSKFLLGLAPFLHECHRLCGNFRTLSWKETLKRQVSLAMYASVQNLSELRHWAFIFKRFRIDYEELLKDSEIRGPIFKLAIAPYDEVSEKQSEVNKGKDVKTGAKEYYITKKRLWNLLRLINADKEDISRFFAASSLVHSPVNYDRIVAIGRSGIIPASALALCFTKRLSVLFLEPLDLFPLPSRLEKITVVDDSLQTSYTACVALDNLRRFSFHATENDVFVVLKNVGVLDSAEELIENVTYKGIRKFVTRAKSIIEYEYPGDVEDMVEPKCVIDRSNAVPSEMIKHIEEHIKYLIETCGGDGGVSEESIFETCNSEVFYKAELLFNKPRELFWLAKKWHEKIQKSGKVGTMWIIASDPLDLPIMTHIAIITRFSERTERLTKFLLYDPDEDALSGEIRGENTSDVQFFVIDTTIKSGSTLRRIKKKLEKLRRREIMLSGCCAIFSRLSESELKRIGIERLFVEKYVDSHEGMSLKC